MIRRWLAALSLTLLAALLTASVVAQPSYVFWERWDVEIDNVDAARNRFEVTETYEVRFEGTARFGQRVIAYTNLESIDNVSVRVDGQPLDESCAEVPGVFCPRRVEEGLSIVYRFPQPVTDDTVSVEISYTVNGALYIYEGGDQLRWTAVTDEKFGYGVGESTVTVNLPPEYAPREDIDPVETFGAPGEITVNGGRIVARATRGVQPDEAFEIRAQFPHNPNASIARWQPEYDRQQATQPLIDLFSIAGSLLIALGAPLGMFAMWYTRGRDPKIGVVPEYLSEPPSDLPPALVGTLIDETADMRDVISTLVDLAHRGYLVIEEERKQLIFGISGGSEFSFKRTDKETSDLRSFERSFLSKLFDGRLEVSMDSLRNSFYVHIPGLKEALYDELVQERLFNSKPSTVRSGWSAVGIVILVGTGLMTFWSLSTLEALSPSLLCLPIALGIAGVAVLLGAQYMPHKTSTGAEAAAKWRAFREYLANLERYKQVEEAVDVFDTYLPYAVAFGMDRVWIRKFSRVEYTPVPPWYYPTHWGGYYSGGYTAGSPAPRGLPGAGDVLPGELSQAGGGGFLEDMSTGLSGSLESISDGLTSMLNSASSALSSRPQSSSGSSGSWGGGGSSWSGGGGGSSGGGSSGFG